MSTSSLASIAAGPGLAARRPALEESGVMAFRLAIAAEVLAWMSDRNMSRREWCLLGAANHVTRVNNVLSGKDPFPTDEWLRVLSRRDRLDLRYRLDRVCDAFDRAAA